MSDYVPPYTVSDRSTVDFYMGAGIKNWQFVVLYQDDHPVMQTNRAAYAKEICDAMNMAHRAGWFDGRAYEGRNVSRPVQP